MILNYLGSKHSLLPYIDHIIKPLIDKNTVFCDLFQGSGCVSNHYKHLVSKIITCDTELYSYVLGYALMKCLFSKKLEQIIYSINYTKSKRRGLIWKFFSNKHLYFRDDNAQRIDYIRIYINELYQNNSISYDEFMFLLASLLKSASKYANTTGTFRAHLKQLSKKADKHFVFIPIHTDYACITHEHNIVHKNDAIRIIPHINPDIIYIDPPYNTVHYGAYYSFLNYLCLYDQNVTLTGPGIIQDYYKSKFGFKKYAESQFTNLFKTVRAKYVILSYSSNAVLSIKNIVNIINTFSNPKTIVIYKVKYKKYQSHNMIKSSHVYEYFLKIEY